MRKVLLSILLFILSEAAFAVTSRLDVIATDSNGESKSNFLITDPFISIQEKAYFCPQVSTGNGTYKFTFDIFSPAGTKVKSITGSSQLLDVSGSCRIITNNISNISTSFISEAGAYRILGSFTETYATGTPSTTFGETTVQFTDPGSALFVQQIQLITPSNRANIYTSRPIFQWLPNSQASSYSIFVSEYENVEAAPLWSKTAISTTSIQYPNDVRNLEQGKKYYWMVKEYDRLNRPVGPRLGRSQIYSFYIGKGDGDQIILKAPVEEVKVQQASFSFEWEELKGEHDYEVLLFTEENQEQPFWSGNTRDAYLIYTAAEPELTQGKTYFWKVRSVVPGYSKITESELASFVFDFDHSTIDSSEELSSNQTGIYGQVFDQLNEPLAKVSISLEGPLKVEDDLTLESVATSLKGGYASELLPGRYKVKAYKAGYTIGNLEVEIKTGERLKKDLVLISKKTSFFGTVYHKYSNAPIDSARVTLRSPTFEKSVLTNSSGGFVFDQVTAGDYTLELEFKPFFKSQSINLVLKKGINKAQYTLSPHGMGTVTGYIKDNSGGGTVSFARVSAQAIELADSSLFPNEGADHGTVSLTGGGRYEISGLKPGKYKVSVESPLLKVADQNVQITGGGTSRLDFSFDRQQRLLSGRVTDKDNKPLSNVRITFDDFPRLPGCYSNTTGNFECRVYEGTINTTFYFPGYEELKREIMIDENDKNIGDVALNLRKAKIRFLVKDNHGAPVPDVNVAVSLGTAQTLKTALSGLTGEITVPYWQAFKADFSPTQGNYEFKSQMIRIREGESLEREIILRKTITFNGIVQNQSRYPLGDAEISIPGFDTIVRSTNAGRFSMAMPELSPMPESVLLVVKRAGYYTERRTVMVALRDQDVVVRLRSEREKATSFTSVRINNSIREIRTELDDIERWVQRSVQKVLRDLGYANDTLEAYQKLIDVKEVEIKKARDELIKELDKPYLSANALRLSVKVKALNDDLKLLTSAMELKVLSQLDAIERFIKLFKLAVELRFPVMDIKLEDLLDSILQSPFLDEENRARLKGLAEQLRDRFENDVKEFYRVKSEEIDRIFAEISSKIKRELQNSIELRRNLQGELDGFVKRIEGQIEERQKEERERPLRLISVVPENENDIAKDQPILLIFNKTLDTEKLTIKTNGNQPLHIKPSSTQIRFDSVTILPFESWQIGTVHFNIQVHDLYGKTHEEKLKFKIARAKSKQPITIPDLPENESACPKEARDCIDLADREDLELAQKIAEVQDVANAIKNKVQSGVNEINRIDPVLKDFYTKIDKVNANYNRLQQAINHLHQKTISYTRMFEAAQRYALDFEQYIKLEEIGGLKLDFIFNSVPNDIQKMQVSGAFILKSKILGDWDFEVPEFEVELSNLVDEGFLELRNTSFNSYRDLEKHYKEQEFHTLVSLFGQARAKELFPASVRNFSGNILPPSLVNLSKYTQTLPQPLREFDAEKIFPRKITEFDIKNLTEAERTTLLSTDTYSYVWGHLSPFMKVVVPESREQLDKVKPDFLVRKYLPADVVNLYDTYIERDEEKMAAAFQRYLPKDIQDKYFQQNKANLDPKILLSKLDDTAITDLAKSFLSQPLKENLPENFFTMTWEDIAPEYLKGFDPIKIKLEAEEKLIDEIFGDEFDTGIKEISIGKSDSNFKMPFTLKNLKIVYEKEIRKAYVGAKTIIDLKTALPFLSNAKPLELGLLKYYADGNLDGDVREIDIAEAWDVLGFPTSLKGVSVDLKNRKINFRGDFNLGLSRGSSGNETTKVEITDCEWQLPEGSSKWDFKKFGVKTSPPIKLLGLELNSMQYQAHERLLEFGGSLNADNASDSFGKVELKKIAFQDGAFVGADMTDFEVEFKGANKAKVSLKIKELSVYYKKESPSTKYFHLQVSGATLGILFKPFVHKPNAENEPNEITIEKLDVKWYKSKKPDITFEHLVIQMEPWEFSKKVRFGLTELDFTYKQIEGRKRWQVAVALVVEVDIAGSKSGGGGSGSCSIQSADAAEAGGEGVAGCAKIEFTEGKKPRLKALAIRVKMSGFFVYGKVQFKDAYMYAQVAAGFKMGASNVQVRGEYYHASNGDWFVSAEVRGLKPGLPIFELGLAQVYLTGGGIKVGERQRKIVFGIMGEFTASIVHLLDVFEGTGRFSLATGAKLATMQVQGKLIPDVQDATGLKLMEAFVQAKLHYGSDPWLSMLAQTTTELYVVDFATQADLFLNSEKLVVGFSMGYGPSENIKSQGPLDFNISASVLAAVNEGEDPIRYPFFYKGTQYRLPPDLKRGFAAHVSIYVNFDTRKLIKGPISGQLMLLFEAAAAMDLHPDNLQRGVGVLAILSAQVTVFNAAGFSVYMALDAGGMQGRKSWYVSAVGTMQGCVMVGKMQKCFTLNGKVRIGNPPFDLPDTIASPCDGLKPKGRMRVQVQDMFGVPVETGIRVSPANNFSDEAKKAIENQGCQTPMAKGNPLHDLKKNFKKNLQNLKKDVKNVMDVGRYVEMCENDIKKTLDEEQKAIQESVQEQIESVQDSFDVEKHMKALADKVQTQISQIGPNLAERLKELPKKAQADVKQAIQDRIQECLENRNKAAALEEVELTEDGQFCDMNAEKLIKETLEKSVNSAKEETEQEVSGIVENAEQELKDMFDVNKIIGDAQQALQSQVEQSQKNFEEAVQNCMSRREEDIKSAMTKYSNPNTWFSDPGDGSEQEEIPLTTDPYGEWESQFLPLGENYKIEVADPKGIYELHSVIVSGKDQGENNVVRLTHAGQAFTVVLGPSELMSDLYARAVDPNGAPIEGTDIEFVLRNDTFGDSNSDKGKAYEKNAMQVKLGKDQYLTVNNQKGTWGGFHSIDAQEPYTLMAKPKRGGRYDTGEMRIGKISTLGKFKAQGTTMARLRHLDIKLPLAQRTIKGGVYSELLPVEDATVTLKGGGDEKTFETTSEGKFIFRNIDVGSYTLKVSKENYKPYSQEISLENTMQNDLVIDISKQKNQLTVKAFDAARKPVARTRFVAVAGNKSESCRTSSAGTCVMPGLEVGTPYLLSVDPAERLKTISFETNEESAVEWQADASSARVKTTEPSNISATFFLQTGPLIVANVKDKTTGDLVSIAPEDVSISGYDMNQVTVKPVTSGENSFEISLPRVDQPFEMTIEINKPGFQKGFQTAQLKPGRGQQVPQVWPTIQLVRASDLQSLLQEKTVKAGPYQLRIPRNARLKQKPREGHDLSNDQGSMVFEGKLTLEIGGALVENVTVTFEAYLDANGEPHTKILDKELVPGTNFERNAKIDTELFGMKAELSGLNLAIEGEEASLQADVVELKDVQTEIPNLQIDSMSLRAEQQRMINISAEGKPSLSSNMSEVRFEPLNESPARVNDQEFEMTAMSLVQDRTRQSSETSLVVEGYLKAEVTNNGQSAGIGRLGGEPGKLSLFFKTNDTGLEVASQNREQCFSQNMHVPIEGTRALLTIGCVQFSSEGLKITRAGMPFSQDGQARVSLKPIDQLQPSEVLRVTGITFKGTRINIEKMRVADDERDTLEFTSSQGDETKPVSCQKKDIRFQLVESNTGKPYFICEQE